ncbi:MAG: phytoene desaturase [Candidatus Auribacter fodinae]|jgi:phytoene desaturase|uniref:Phytoene desaturase n=1 Tax=Candidatus Auribacter fodinae TaxID=2093366 RepID=A0A3A4R5H0_9BACT|nr:MAG: phytoene desaturase [Candidatus Auribacter fodinae]
MAKKIAIIGAGPGGLTAGMILAKNGFNVEIFEKESVVGGRNAPICLDGYTFDTGPTFLMMHFVLEEIFKMTGRKLSDYIEIKQLNPMYRLKFNDLEFLPSNNAKEMKKQIDHHFPGNESGYDKFLEQIQLQYEKMYDCLKMDYSNFSKLYCSNMLKALPYLKLGKSLYNNLGRFFKDEKLKLSFTFQAKYLGMSPWECPAAFTMIPYVEHRYGIYHVTGGLNKISLAMKKVIEELSGKVHLKTKVKQLILEKKTVKGLVLENGSKVYADEVIVNSDFAYSMSNLVEEGILKKYSKEKLKDKRYSCSTFMLYLGLDKKYDIPHHNIFFANDYRQNIQDIFHSTKLSDDMSIYIQNASVTDPTLAPEGHSTIYVLVPVPNNKSSIDWEKEKESFKNKVLERIVQKTEMKDFKAHIKVEKIITPADWQNNYNVYLGATFNLAHNLTQMLYFRPHNKYEELDNCYLVGGGTHPGSGLPTIYESGRISSELIMKKYKVAQQR